MFSASEEWMADAKCLSLSVTRGPSGEPSEVDAMFYPEDTNANGAARKFCKGTVDREPCPVREDCLAAAIGYGDRYGVWGGKSFQERNAHRNKTAASRG
jgi:hypothetical protein